MVRESQTCRVCTKRSKDYVELETIYGRKPSISYLEVYNICTQLNALVDDELPKSLCSSCSKELKSSFKFVEKARETDQRLRESLCGNRSTRSRRRDNYEEPPPEPVFEEIKPEFINCTKDPLEDSDIEVNEKSEDEMDWVPEEADDMQTDGFAEEKTATIDEDDDDDDKPLKQLIEKRKLNTLSTEENPDYDSSDVFNDLPLPADNDNSSDNEDDIFKDKMMEVVPDPPKTQEAQIFPQGRYMCKMCKQTYFTADGLKAHMNVHLPKKKKDKRIRGPNKKNSKTKKKKKNAASDDEDDDDDDGDAEKAEPPNEVSLEGKEESTATAEVEVKKKRKNKPPKPKKMFPCGVCGKHMISASKLRYHMVMHTGEKDFLCTMCPKAYSTIYALKHHMRTHTGERPYECKFCGDKFTRPTTLKSHMRRHTGERPYGCDICGKRFIQHSSMTTHMKLNHMAKTIGCPHCDKKYARQTDLNTHLLSHTGDKPFSCSLCPSRFIRQANLNKHMNQHHLAKNKPPKASGHKKNLELETDQGAPEKEASVSFVVDRAVGPTNAVQFVGSSPIPAQNSPKLAEVSGRMNNQFAAPTNNADMQQKISFAVATNQFNPVESTELPPLPKMISVRSLARPVQKGGVVNAMGRVQDASTPPGNGSDESNSSNRFQSLSSPNAVSPQLRHQQMQQNNMLLPLGQQQQRLSNNENSMPINVNIAGIPGGIPTHSMLAGTGVAVHLSQHGQIGSVEQLKGIHPPVDNLTNLLGQVIDPERIGRSVEEIIPWSWSNNS